MKTLEILENKFNPAEPVLAGDEGSPPRQASEASPAPPATPTATPPAVQVIGPAWRSCASVVALSEYLKARDWIHLVSYADGAHGLRFDGGISPAAAERWAAAREALALLADADEDLRRLIRSGDLKLPCTDQVPVSHHWADADDHPRGFFLSTGPSHPSKDRGTRTAR
jgi:hypothetical protein